MKLNLPKLTLPSFPAPRPLLPNEFDPALARVIHTPPNPLARMVYKIAGVLLAVALLWAMLGRIDIVAVAQGRLVPMSYVKIVQPTEAGIVREILVREGQAVRAGQTMMRMDPTLSSADLTELRTEHQRKRLALRRIDAELSQQAFLQVPDDDPAMYAEVAAQMRANRAALDAAIAQEQATRSRATQDLAAAMQTSDKLAQTLPLTREQEHAYRQLISEGFSGKLMANDKARQRIENEQDLKAQDHIIARERATIAMSDRRIAQLRGDSIRQLRNERAEIADRVEKLAQGIAKQDHRQSQLEMKAPQDGRVKDLATHTAGAVVQPGTILMTLVPDSETLRAEVWLSNEDVGFVRAGQPVRLKFSAYQFQKYGMIDGVVDDVAADAAEQSPNPADPSIPQMAYRTLIKLKQQTLLADGQPYRLAAGMVVIAEVKLGDRSVMSYLLSPVQKAWHEAGRER